MKLNPAMRIALKPIINEIPNFIEGLDDQIVDIREKYLEKYPLQEGEKDLIVLLMIHYGSAYLIPATIGPDGKSLPRTFEATKLRDLAVQKLKDKGILK